MKQSRLAGVFRQKPSTNPDDRSPVDQTTKQGSRVSPWVVWLLALGGLFQIRHLEHRVRDLETRRHSFGRPWQSSPVLPSLLEPRPHSSLASTAAAATATYWMNTVYYVEASDFGMSQPDRCTVGEMLQQFRNALTKTKEQPTQDVDPELVQMVHRQITEWQGTIGELIGRSPKAALEQSVQEALAKGQSFLEAEPALTQDPAARAIYEFWRQIVAIAERQRQETIAMQVRLAERYQGHSFPLPDEEKTGN